ncbi:hypothetical protein HAX54_021814 [Datura stramonium]|uniref:Uncharacterized protein n=1 Tax=Datura stramonium TaxID=4076 RepID=A0ABS8UUG8_DATST|nr:hypothetical protein [Datura stramonium]
MFKSCLSCPKPPEPLGSQHEPHQQVPKATYEPMVLETARQVASYPASSTPMPYDQVKNQCEALVTESPTKSAISPPTSITTTPNSTTYCCNISHFKIHTSTMNRHVEQAEEVEADQDMRLPRRHAQYDKIQIQNIQIIKGVG